MDRPIIPRVAIPKPWFMMRCAGASWVLYRYRSGLKGLDGRRVFLDSGVADASWSSREREFPREGDQKEPVLPAARRAPRDGTQGPRVRGGRGFWLRRNA